MTVSEIQTQIADLTTRRAQIVAQYAAQNVAVKRAQDALIAGTGDPKSASDALGALAALQGALDALDAQADAARDDLTAAQLADAHTAKIARCVVLADEATASKAAFDDAFASGVAALGASVAALLAAADELDAQRGEFQSLVPTETLSPDLALVKAATNASALLGWGSGSRRPSIFDTLNADTAPDLERALSRAYEVRDTHARQARSAARPTSPAYAAEPSRQ